MNFTYVASDNTAGNAQILSLDADQDVYVKKVIFGNPTDGVKVKLYNKSVAYGSASGMASTDSNNVAVILTVPTAAAGKNYQQVYDFTGEGCPGLQLNGGSFHSNTNDVTVIWEPVESEGGGA